MSSHKRMQKSKQNKRRTAWSTTVESMTFFKAAVMRAPMSANTILINQR
jgi:hypothetical protein